jgi:glucose/arabinose dehydrogenase
MANLPPTGRVASLFVIFYTSAALANSPPLPPVITEPVFDGRIVNPEDVHMETGPFADPDPGDQHLCTSWEIWTISPSERVWDSTCQTGVERVHIHLGDGVFQGSFAGRHSLLPETDYQLRVRHRDDSGDPPTEWSPWSVRLFTTGPGSQIFPLELDDVSNAPAPTWTDDASVPITLPGGAAPASLQLGSAAGDLLLEFRGDGSPSNQIINPGPLAEHIAIRVRMQASGSAGLLLPESSILFRDDQNAVHTIYLPAVTLGAGQAAYYWVARSGSTYVGNAGQTTPDFSTLARGSPVPWIATPGYRVEIVASGFQLPVNIAFVLNPGGNPDSPVFYVTELYGTIKVVKRDGSIGDYATGLLNFNPTGDFPGSGEQGLAGLAIEPTTGDLFVSLLYDSAPPDGPHYPKVMRFHSNDGGQTAATSSIVLDMPGEEQGQSHQISNVSIGPDGKLYVHMGDGFDAATSQNLNSFRGKVLRLNFNGTAPSDNPFYNAADGITSRDYVYAYGFRNPFGGTWRAADGGHYEVENGPTVDRFAKVIRGVNYGYNESDASMYINALYVWNPAVAPVNITFVQPQTFSGSGFPAALQGQAFVSESGPTWGTGPQTEGKRVTRFVLDASGNVVSGPIDFVVYNGEGKATAVGLAAGPDGLYFSDLYKDQDYDSPIDRGANILRIKFIGVANFTASASAGPAPLTVHFTDTSNAVGPTAWVWDFGDGAASNLRNPTHTYMQDGVYNVRLSVTTANGVLVEQKNGFIRVGATLRVALIGGSLPPEPADEAVADFLLGSGYEVVTFDDEPDARPAASEMAEEFDCVVISSTVASDNIGGEFRTAAVPLVFWEQGLLSTSREALCDDGGVSAGWSDLTIIDNTHPITSGLALGDLPVYLGASVFSVGLGAVGPDAIVLGYRESSGVPALIAANEGAELLAGYVAPGRRVFVFLEDSSFLDATADGRMLLRRSVDWAKNAAPPACVGDVDGDRDVDLQDLTFLLGHFGDNDAAPEDGDVNQDGNVDLQDLAILLARFGIACP